MIRLEKLGKVCAVLTVLLALLYDTHVFVPALTPYLAIIAIAVVVVATPYVVIFVLAQFWKEAH